MEHDGLILSKEAVSQRCCAGLSLLDSGMHLVWATLSIGIAGLIGPDYSQASIVEAY